MKLWNSILNFHQKYIVGITTKGKYCCLLFIVSLPALSWTCTVMQRKCVFVPHILIWWNNVKNISSFSRYQPLPSKFIYTPKDLFFFCIWQVCILDPGHKHTREKYLNAYFKLNALLFPRTQKLNVIFLSISHKHTHRGTHAHNCKTKVFCVRFSGPII